MRGHGQWNTSKIEVLLIEVKPKLYTWTNLLLLAERLVWTIGVIYTVSNLIEILDKMCSGTWNELCGPSEIKSLENNVVYTLPSIASFMVDAVVVVVVRCWNWVRFIMLIVKYAIPSNIFHGSCFENYRCAGALSTRLYRNLYSCHVIRRLHCESKRQCFLNATRMWSRWATHNTIKLSYQVSLRPA